MGSAIGAVLIGAVGAGLIAGALGFQSTISGNTVGLAIAGGGIALGAAAGAMGYPVAGVGLAAAGAGVGLAQFATYEVAQYEANNATAPQMTTSGMGAINGPSDTIPLHSMADMQAARANLRRVIR